MSGYRPANLTSPTEENLSSNYTASHSTRSTGPRSGGHLTAGGHGRTSVLSQNMVRPGSHAGTEAELGPYSALRTRSAASTHTHSDDSAGPKGAGGGVVALIGEKEADDYLHEGDADKRSYAPSVRGVANALTLIILALALLMLFAGYPILANLEKVFDTASAVGFNLGGSNGSGQVPEFSNLASLIDSDTPSNAQTWTHPLTGDGYHLVFSDEFEVEGRTFWEGDDPFWTAVDIWYGVATGDYQWYSPEAVNTTGGALQITLEEHVTHNLHFRSGMVQSWNQFCFQGGYIEWNVMQPGTPETTGYWPATWLMGNLGRAGYLGTSDGMWPYSYQGCDAGILPNQTWLNLTGPDQAINSDATYAKSDGGLSSLPGMRLPSCTCSGGDHPGPNVNVGRSAPEIDCIEAQIQYHEEEGGYRSYSSQSLQTAPFDVDYFWGNTSDVATIYNDSETTINTYVGGPLQEAVSAVSRNPDRAFDLTDKEYSTYGIEYKPDWNGDGGGSVTWFIDGTPTWTVQGASIGPVAEMDIGQRTVPTEPMYIIMNLGLSVDFQPVLFSGAGERNLVFPAYLRIDYVRVYQLDGQADRISCDPPDHPTADYIANHPLIYQNANITQYSQVYDRPPNSLRDGC